MGPPFFFAFNGLQVAQAGSTLLAMSNIAVF